MLQIYNSLTGELEHFRPIVPGKVGMYVCGMTVYDLCHLGHARMLLVFDMVSRYLRSSGYDVTYVRNITDVDDKINAASVESGEDIGVITERFTAGCARKRRKPLGVRPALSHILFLEPRIFQIFGFLKCVGRFWAPGGVPMARSRNFASDGLWESPWRHF